MEAQDFTTESLTKGQGVYFRKGAAAVVASRWLNDEDPETKRMNERNLADIKAHPNAIQINTGLGSAMGYSNRLATKGELKGLIQSANERASMYQKQIDAHTAKSQHHKEKAEKNATAGDKFKAAYHLQMVAHHDEQVRRHQKALKAAQKKSERYTNDLNDRFSGGSGSTGGQVGGQKGHPFYGNQHVSR